MSTRIDDCFNKADRDRILIRTIEQVRQVHYDFVYSDMLTSQAEEKLQEVGISPEDASALLLSWRVEWLFFRRLKFYRSE